MGKVTKVRENGTEYEFQCPCTGSLCGVGRTTGQLRKAFYARFSDDEHSRSVERRVGAMGKHFKLPAALMHS